MIDYTPPKVATDPDSLRRELMAIARRGGITDRDRIVLGAAIGALGQNSQAALDVAAERRRQIEAEGWTPEHDDKHDDGSLGAAAACYAATQRPDGMCPAYWPWQASWWKPKDRRSDLVRAGALILAEIERLDRAAAVPKWKACSRCANPTYCGEHLRGCDLDELAR